MKFSHVSFLLDGKMTGADGGLNALSGLSVSLQLFFLAMAEPRAVPLPQTDN